MGGQAVVAIQPLPSTRLTLAAGDYFFSKTDGIAQARNSNSSLKITNSVILEDGTIVKGGRSLTPGTGDKEFQRFLGGFNIVNASMQLEYNTGYAQWPFTLMADFAHNTDAKMGMISRSGLGQALERPAIPVIGHSLWRGRGRKPTRSSPHLATVTLGVTVGRMSKVPLSRLITCCSRG